MSAVAEPTCLPARRAHPRALGLHQQRGTRTALLDIEKLGDTPTMNAPRALQAKAAGLDFDRDRWKKHSLSDRGRDCPKIGGGIRGVALRSRREQARSSGSQNGEPASRFVLLAK